MGAHVDGSPAAVRWWKEWMEWGRGTRFGAPFPAPCVGGQVGGELICKREKELDQISEVFLSLSSAW